MKKPYVKPTITKVEMDSDIIRMFSKQGFLDLFTETLQEARRENQSITHEQIFDCLNEKFFNAVGSFRYSSYDAFRRRKDH
jgi:hypothetical protein